MLEINGFRRISSNLPKNHMFYINDSINQWFYIKNHMLKITRNACFIRIISNLPCNDMFYINDSINDWFYIENHMYKITINQWF